MKRFIILFALIISAVGASAQSIGTLFRQYRYEERPTTCTLLVLRCPSSRPLLRPIQKTKKHSRHSLHSDSLLGGLYLDRQTELSKDAPDLRPTGYTPFIIAKKNDEVAYIYLKEKDGYIRELLILTTDNHDGAIVQIKGKLRPDDIRRRYRKRH